MARAFPLNKNQDFLKTLRFSLLQFENEFNITANQHIANKLGFKTSAQFTNLLQPFNEKYMKVDELFIILDNIDGHSKLICQPYIILIINLFKLLFQFVTSYFRTLLGTNFYLNYAFFVDYNKLLYIQK